MQKVIFYLTVILSVCMFASCSKDDDVAISLNEKEVTLQTDGTQQLKATGEVSKWSSKSDFIASVSENGMITGNHVGETIIMVQGSGSSALCRNCHKLRYFFISVYEIKALIISTMVDFKIKRYGTNRLLR